MEPGYRLRQARERLALTYRDVERASMQIAENNRNSEFIVHISRLAEIENHGVTPNLYKLYSLCAIYRLEPQEVAGWYGVPWTQRLQDSVAVPIKRTHLVDRDLSRWHAALRLPVRLDPGFDPRKTTYLTRMIEAWGPVPVALLEELDGKCYRYGYIGLEDRMMYPLLKPGSLVQLDETRNRIVNSGWRNEFERPIYFIERRSGYNCCWCYLNDRELILQPHPLSPCSPELLQYPQEAEVIGQVVGVAMRLAE